MKRSLSHILGIVSLALLFVGCTGAPIVSAQENLERSGAANGVPGFPTEFRGAWSACVYNIDWPSKAGLSASTQKAQLVQMLDKMAALNMNAIIFQVRPQADAVYYSALEPWSGWVSGQMGRSPGYDPLQYCIQQAHARGIEVHAWFNPFRASPNKNKYASASHISRSAPHLVKQYGDYLVMDISRAEVRQHALNVMMDVVRRYDIDGVHLDDYFYPYPKKGLGDFPDGRSPSQRRAYIDQYVSSLYSSVKGTKPWVRVGISPFGIWKPGVPSGVEANVSAYDQLACDAPKWLRNGWVDYMMPQLYWRDHSAQSYSKLLSWWRGQGSRPVWPGIATSRINSSEDPGRPASEITHQVQLSRTVGRNWVGHAHWSAKALMQNRGGISTQLSRGAYAYPALVPPMPWIASAAPPVPAGRYSRGRLTWSTQDASKVAIQVLSQGQWIPYRVVPAYLESVGIPTSAEAVAIRSVNRYGQTSAPIVLR